MSNVVNATASIEWERYWHERTPENRNAVVAANLNVAEKYAKVMHIKLARRADFDTLLSGAMLGLMGAVEKYNPAMGVSFVSFADHKIKGGMLDDLRRTDPCTRRQRTCFKDVDKAEAAFYAEHGRPPTDDELRTALGLDDAEFKRRTKYARQGRYVNRSFTNHSSKTVNPSTKHGRVAHSKTLVCDSDREKVERSDWWQAAVSGLDRREKTMILLYYRDGLTMKQIGRTIGLSESRISQEVARLTVKMRSSPILQRLLAAETRGADCAA